MGYVDRPPPAPSASARAQAALRVHTWAALLAFVPLVGCEVIAGIEDLTDQQSVGSSASVDDGGPVDPAETGPGPAHTEDNGDNGVVADAAADLASEAIADAAPGLTSEAVADAAPGLTSEAVADAVADLTSDAIADAAAQTAETSQNDGDTGSDPPEEDGATDGDTVVFKQSCSVSGPGLSDCGTERDASCCESPAVAGGPFFRTYQNSGTGPTGEADPATISSFALDKYLVTVGRFRQFVTAWKGGWLPAEGTGKHTHLNGGMGLNSVDGGYEPGWLASYDADVDPTDVNLACGSSGFNSNTAAGDYYTWTPVAATNENLPINCANWYEAYAFCIWDGGFLPSEAEWAYAAAGGSAQLEYPWGVATPGTATLYADYNCYYPDSSGRCTGFENIAPVGTASLNHRA
jgi:formylglycine-generating enzyme required for sulfatase activity